MLSTQVLKKFRYNKPMRYPVIASLVLGLCFGGLLSACVINPQPDRPTLSDLRLPDYEDLISGGGTDILDPDLPRGGIQSPSLDTGELRETLRLQYGIQLNNAQWAQLRALAQVSPNGEWSASANRTAQENLEVNYQRFSPLFTPLITSVNEYKLKAVSFAENPQVPFYLDVNYFVTRQSILLVKWSEASGEFILLQPDGTVANYLITRDITPANYVKVQF